MADGTADGTAGAVVKAAAVSIHGPYEDLGIKALESLDLVLAGQDAATRAECWKRYMEATKPLHEAVVRFGDLLSGKVAAWVAGLESSRGGGTK
jgi:hypothetical protein